MSPTFRRLAGPALASAVALALSACAALPDVSPLATPRPVDAYATTRSLDAARADWPAETWWRAYGDAQLDQLIDEALAGSPSIATAQARLARAESVVQTSRAATRPQLRGNASISEQKQSYDYLTPRAAVPEGWKDYGRATLDFSWDLDFWGRNRAALAAALSDAEAAKADAAQARLMLAASMASGYAEFARLWALQDTAEAALTVREKTVALFRMRRENGLETLGSVRQVEARRAMAEADLLSAREQLVLQRHRLAALAGAGPDRGLTLERPRLDVERDFGLPEQLPAQLLGRRPDIVAARLRVEAALGRVDSAKAAFYPDVNLTAFAGMQSLGLSKLTDSGAFIGSIGPAISLPIFDGGRLRGQFRGARADADAAVASYDQAVVQALQEVADIAASTRSLGGEIASTDAGVDAAREAWEIQQRRYTGGLSTYLEVLNAEDAWLSNRRAQTDLRSRAFTLDVSLKRSLGGGYAPTPKS
ncbi:efflux transporter outer membrane subunit [Roseateles chitinivorans]|uniref:efflux transporter outer membrane subunit n=1 Tax=Roseateles chitinivorans TaxID=2917965 RepID=UPI003D676732